MKSNATKLANSLKNSGFDAFVKKEDGYYRVQCGGFSKHENALALVDRLKKAGYDAIIKIVD